MVRLIFPTFVLLAAKVQGAMQEETRRAERRTAVTFFKRIILFIVLSLKKLPESSFWEKQMSANAAACFSTWLIKV